MARYECGVQSAPGSNSVGFTGAAAQPYCQLGAGATYPLRLLEVGIWNTTVTACDASLLRVTTLGTGGTSTAGVDEQTGDSASTGAVMVTTFTSIVMSATYMRRGKLAAAIGSGYIWSWVYPGIFIPVSTGIAVVNGSGVGQALGIYWVWDE